MYEICDQYEAHQLQKAYHSERLSEGSQKIVRLDSSVSIVEVAFFDHSDAPTNMFQTGDALKVRIRYHTTRIVQHPIFTVSLLDQEGKLIFDCYSDRVNAQVERISGTGEVVFFIEHLNIKPNLYECSVTLSEKEQLNKLEWHEKAYQLVVTNNNHYPINQGLMYPYPQGVFISHDQ